MLQEFLFRFHVAGLLLPERFLALLIGKVIRLIADTASLSRLFEGSIEESIVRDEGFQLIVDKVGGLRFSLLILIATTTARCRRNLSIIDFIWEEFPLQVYLLHREKGAILGWVSQTLFITETCKVL